MKAPFPWFGGKSQVAHIVWEYFGDVPNYVEPFAGSLAVLLGRPSKPRIETVNDLDCHISNFWRAISKDPDQVAHWADWPVNECDLSARHLWLVNQTDFRDQMRTDPDYFDAKIAGWWIWGISSWIGSGWCSSLSNKRPHLGNAGEGINRTRLSSGNAGTGIKDYFYCLAERLRKVRVCCGDWRRVLGPSQTTGNGVTGIFLDPPYSADRDDVYNEDCDGISAKVREYAIEHGNDPLMRIALCGYESEHQMPDNWDCIEWKASGGYGAKTSRGLANRSKERIWFSPYCQTKSLLKGMINGKTRNSHCAAI